MRYFIIILFLTSTLCAHETTKEMSIEMTVGEIVEHICSKIPMTNDKKCMKKKMKCINKDYYAGSEIKLAIFDCF